MALTRLAKLLNRPSARLATGHIPSSQSRVTKNMSGVTPNVHSFNKPEFGPLFQKQHA